MRRCLSPSLRQRHVHRARMALSPLSLVIVILLFHLQPALAGPVSIYGEARTGAQDPELLRGDGGREEGRVEKGGGTSGLKEENGSDRPLPRILTVLTTYGGRSQFVREYRKAVKSHQQLGNPPMIFIVSDVQDNNLDGSVDFRTGQPRWHRLLAAVGEAVSRYKGSFEWLAIGDDDTAFLNNRAAGFLSHIDHTQPLAIGTIDGLNSTVEAVSSPGCYTPEEKQNAANSSAANGCCKDFTHPCTVPVYPETLRDFKRPHWVDGYGENGLYWPYGGTGFFLSSGAVDAMGGVRGLKICSRAFNHLSTDLQAAACLKLHGLSSGHYPGGFHSVTTANSDEIRTKLESECQILGVHLGIRHLDGGPYTPEAFGAAVATVREVDEQWSWSGEELKGACPSAWASVSRYA